MTKRRLLSISTLYPNAHVPRFGTFVARSLEALAARCDWDVTIINPIGIPPIAFGKYEPLAEAAVDGTENGVQIYRPKFTLIPKIGVRFNPRIIARKILPLVQRLHAEQPFDVVDAQFFYPDGPAAAWIAQELQLPFSIKARGSDINYWGEQRYAAKRMLDAAAQADALLSVSKALAADMIALGMPADKIALNYTGLDRDRFRPLGHSGLRQALGQQLGLNLPENDPLFVCAGTLIDRKGQDLAIGAVAAIPDAQLLIAGTGPDEKRLRTLCKDLDAEDRVHFLGSVDHDLLPVIFSAADAMILLSKSEGLANVWIEALACGTPIIICDAGGAREVVTSADAGLIVEPELSEIIAGIKTLLANPPSPENVAATVERFSWTENARNLAQHYDRMIALSL